MQSLKKLGLAAAAIAFFQLPAHAGYVTFAVTGTGFDNVANTTFDYPYSFNKTFTFDTVDTVLVGGGTTLYTFSATSVTQSPFAASIAAAAGTGSSTPTISFTGTPAGLDFAGGSSGYSLYLSRRGTISASDANSYLTANFGANDPGSAFDYVEFANRPSESFSSVAFFGSAQITSFSLTALPPVPEPETYALLVAGLGVIGYVARRKSARKSTKRAD